MAVKIVNEAINPMEKADIAIESMPRFSFSKMNGNHVTEGEYIFCRYTVEDDFYKTDEKMIDVYTKEEENNEETTNDTGDGN